jgi:hypothetical protein
VRFLQVRDENLPYPAGEALIAATVRLYGAASLARLLRAFAQPTLPTDLIGTDLWRAAYQLAGMDLGAVIDEFYREITRYAARHADEIASLPRPRVRVVRNDGRIGVQALLDPSQQHREVLLRFKPTLDSSYDSVDTRRVLPSRPVWREASDIAAGRICVQAGLGGFADQVLYEPWVCLPTRDAVEIGAGMD